MFNFSLGSSLTLLMKRTRSIYEKIEIISHKEMILTPITPQRSQAQISRALLRDS